MNAAQDLSANARKWAKRAAAAASTKTDFDTVILSVGDLLGVTDLFVVSSGRTSRQVKTVAEEVEKQIADDGGPHPVRIEGLGDLTWVLMDYGDFVVHIFQDETRRYYDLERLWSDAPRVEWEDSSTG